MTPTKQFPILAATLISICTALAAPAHATQKQASAEQLDKEMLVYMQQIKAADGAYSETIGGVDEKSP